ncbi:hypothetical protein TanjilG_02846 [Lupinus angustifolius]|uniref:WRC domain-containing protein n=1 Tax=Lupinus angustifolius TaxID=3871 RepID=A0A4P1RLV0_LUPAN|nr:PREDICTED: uncharacterized protein LOC109344852 isoform X2 [Lupinus angustifolius]OIW13326.1 hypothetical protein TanjilG_02846 [Lupinus angustifolius]
MRIRKSQVIFPSYLSSTVSLSDPNLINRSTVVVQLNDVTTTTTTHHASATASSLDHYQPSDQTLPPIGKLSNGYDPPRINVGGAHKQDNNSKQQPLDEDVRKQYSGDSEDKHNSDFSKGGILGSDIVVHQVLPPSSPSSTQDVRWCEREKAIPLKKRRGCFQNNGDNLGNSSKKMKTKMNKKCSTQNDNNKKRVKGSAVMEGSRCSRVNGRGWRCCQQTLVGYSLCEHHLGKGVRSMSSVRSKSIVSSTIVPDMKLHDGMSQSLSCASSFHEKRSKCDSDETLVSDEKKIVIVTKKRMKLGIVKARSMSSLLGQTKNNTVVRENNT